MSVEKRAAWVFSAIAVLATVVSLCVLGLKWSSKSKPVGPAAEPLKVLTLKPVDLSKPSVRSEIRQALGQDPRIGWEQRIAILHSFDDTPSGPECDAMLFAALQPRRNVSSALHSTWAHEMFRLVQRQAGVADKLARVLATLALDSKRDGVVRDYSLQHLRILWGRGSTKAPLRHSIVATFSKLAVSDDPLAASALLSLHVLGSEMLASNVGAGENAERIPVVSDEELSPLLRKAFASSGSGKSAGLKITAIRVVNERRIEGFLPEIRRMASGRENQQILVRMAAISALGTLGTDGDRRTLASIRTDDRMIREAIDKSISKNP